MRPIQIPEKLTFRRKEVIQLAKLDGKVLDYWESEFAVFSPVDSQSGERFYSRKDIEVILKIKEWLNLEKLDKNKIMDVLKNVSRRTMALKAAGRSPGLKRMRSSESAAN